MNVLIVDDLENVVRSMREGVDWRKAAVEKVFTATSVEEAKQVLRAYSVDLLLCDIEMPPSDGFALLSWAREQNADIECIFLTSHAEFEYARKAVKMGSFDYILQPARYSDIEAAVKKALERIRAHRLERDRARFGKYWQDKSGILGEATLGRFLRRGGRDADVFVEEMQQLGFALSKQSEMCLVLFQPHAPVDRNDIEKLRLLFAEVLGRSKHNMLIIEQAQDALLVALFGSDETWTGIAAALENILDRYRRETGKETRPACYIGMATMPEGLYAQWLQLTKRMQNNVAHYGGVFALSQHEEIPGYTYLFPDMRTWGKQLENGQCERVREEVCRYLTEERDAGRCSAEFLARFYRDFTQMFFMAVGAGTQRSTLKLPEQLTFDGYIDAYSSYDSMMDMVDSVLRELQRHVRVQGDDNSPIRKAMDYIRQNMEKDIHCSDIADAVFMSEDHISRIFKKELGISLSSFIIAEKIRTAENLLTGTNLPVSIIASKVGYPNFSYFSQVFKKQTGFTPNEYRSRNR